MRNIIFTILLLSAYGSNIHLFAQKKGGSLEIHFPKSIDGSVAIHEWVENIGTGSMEMVTVDSAKIVRGMYTYKYDRENQRQVYLDVFPKDSLHSVRIFLRNTYFENYLDCIVLDNSHAIVKTDSAFFKSRRGLQLRATLEGSPETDMFFKLTCDAYNEASQYQFTNPEQGHVINFDFIKMNSKSQFLLGKIYGDRTCYGTLDSLKTALSLFDTSVQNTLVGRKLTSYIREQAFISDKGIADKFIYFDSKDREYTFEQFLNGKQFGLIVFWASWCAPCIREIPELRELHAKFKDNVSFVSLSVDKNKQQWMNAVDTYAVDWLNLAGFPNSNTKVVDTFGIGLVPCFLVVDGAGKVLLNTLSGKGEIEGEDKYVSVSELDAYFSKLVHK